MSYLVSEAINSLMLHQCNVSAEYFILFKYAMPERLGVVRQLTVMLSFSGLIPESIGALRNLIALDLHSNRFSGEKLEGVFLVDATNPDSIVLPLPLLPFLFWFSFQVVFQSLCGDFRTLLKCHWVIINYTVSCTN